MAHSASVIETDSVAALVDLKAAFLLMFTNVVKIDYICKQKMRTSHNRVRADLAALAFEAGVAEVEGVEEGHQRSDEAAVFGDDAGFEVAAVVAFGTETSSSEIGGADVGESAIGDDALHVHAWAEDAAKEVALDEVGEAVKVSSEAWAGLFGVDEPDFDSFADFACEDLEKGDELFTTADVQIFEIGGDEPE